MSKGKFQLTSCKYENLSNRMQRLRHSQNHSNSTSNLRSTSVDLTNENKLLTRNTSSTLLIQPNINQNSVLAYLQDESCLDIGNRYSGKVTKNTGMRKYNQRMLKQVGNINKKTPPKYTVQVNQSNFNSYKNQNSNQPKNQNQLYPSRKNVTNFQTTLTQTNEVKIKTPTINQIQCQRKRQIKNSVQMQVKYKHERLKLQPGKIYTRQELQKYFAL